MASYEFMESDWKVYRSKRETWIENYAGKLCREYFELLNDDNTSAIDRINTLYHRLQNDIRKTDLVIRHSRTHMKENIYSLLTEGVISLRDLDGFSTELKNWAKYIMEE